MCSWTVKGEQIKKIKRSAKGSLDVHWRPLLTHSSLEGKEAELRGGGPRRRLTGAAGDTAVSEYFF